MTWEHGNEKYLIRNVAIVSQVLFAMHFPAISVDDIEKERYAIVGEYESIIQLVYKPFYYFDAVLAI